MEFNKNHYTQNAMSAEAVVESTRGLVLFYEPLNALAEQDAQFWPRIGAYCDNLSHYPRLLSALSREYSSSMLDFEKGLFCSMFSVLVAQRLDVKPERIRALYYAGLLQDVGSYIEEFKVTDYFANLRERIGGKLHTSSMLQRQKGHALVGYSLLEDEMCDDLLVAELILHHHANEDGTGYPNNVGEKQLNLEMQILVVANKVSEMLFARGGFDELFDCQPEVKLASAMYFKDVNGAALSLLKDASLHAGYAPASERSNPKETVQRDALDTFAISALHLSADLICHEYLQSVRILRAKIKRIDLMLSETGICYKSGYNDFGNDRASFDVLENIDALYDYLTPLLEDLKAVSSGLGREPVPSLPKFKQDLKALLSSLKQPKAFSLFG